MRSRLGYNLLALSASAAFGLLGGATTSKSKSEARTFLDDAGQAMVKMDAGMMVHSTGDVDQDFVQMMVPHHQGAIEMAVAEIRFGHNERLRRIAQEIIVDQTQEIAAMQLALGHQLAPSVAAPDQVSQVRTSASSPGAIPLKICTGRPR
jgi:Domain of unknown function (DUF305)